MRFRILVFLFIISIAVQNGLGQFENTIQDDVKPYWYFFDKVKAEPLRTTYNKDPESMAERVILLINKDIYLRLTGQIRLYMKDLFDEGIDVRAYLIDHKQFQDSNANWGTDAGLRLRKFIRNVYSKVKMNKLYRDKRGLILLGAFPAVFVNWQQENIKLSTSNIEAVNDYPNCAIEIKWKTSSITLTDQKLKYFVNDGEHEISIGTKENPIIQNGGNSSYTFKIPLAYRKGNNVIFKFELQGNKSNKVNWNFLINPSDYVFADIDGFEKPMSAELDYSQNKNDTFGIKARPLVVVTDGVRTNPHGYELAPVDKKYAKAEMYYGRIDAYSLGRGWLSKGIGTDIITHKKPNYTDDNEFYEHEVRLIKKYLYRNHIWRKSKWVRENYNSMYIFRTADVPGKRDEKSDIGKIWEDKLNVTMDDAMFLLNCTSTHKPVAILYPDIGPSGSGTTLSESGNLDTIDDCVSSLEVDLKGGAGAVVLFSEKDFKGDISFFSTDDPDLRNNIVGNDTASSIKFWSCYEYNSPAWDCKANLVDRLRQSWRLVDLIIHSGPYSFTSSDGQQCFDAVTRNLKRRDWDDRCIDEKDIAGIKGDFRFLLNHGCHNLQFMAPGNAGSNFLFENNMLAQWGWSITGTTESEELHRNLSKGERFGAAVLKNSDAQMSAKDANSWRSYFAVVLGDPTLRVFYKSENEDPPPIPDLRVFYDIKLGIKGGFSYTSTTEPIFKGGEMDVPDFVEGGFLKNNGYSDFQTSNSPAFGGGVFLETFFNRSLSAEMGLYYLERAIRTENSEWPDYYDKTIFKTFSVPLQLKLNFRKRNFRYFVGGGVEVSYVLGINNHYHSENGGNVIDNKFNKIGNTDLVEYLKTRFQCSGFAVSGFRLKNIIFELRYLAGLNSIKLVNPVNPDGGEIKIGRFNGVMALIGFSFE